jgi:hypothetical protein
MGNIFSKNQHFADFLTCFGHPGLKSTTTNNDQAYSKGLRPKACLEFLKQWHLYAREIGQNNAAISVLQMRSLLISQAYLNELLVKLHEYSVFYLCVNSTDLRMYSVRFKTRIVFYPENVQQMVSIIRLSKPTLLYFRLDTRDPSTSSDVSELTRLCKAIKGLLFYYFPIITYF